MFTYIIIIIIFNLKFVFLVQVIKHCMLNKLLVMYNVYYFWNNFKNNVRTLSGWFLTKHPVNKNTISLNPEINVLICGCLLYLSLP